MMSRLTYGVGNSWTSAFYEALLSLAPRYCDRFSLIVPHGISLDGRKVLTELAPQLVTEVLVDEWPGTKLLWGEKREMLLYEVNEEAVSVLRRAARSLYDWIAPRLPEDLCFLRSDKEPWFVSITHERHCFFILEPNEKRTLERLLPAPLLEEQKPWTRSSQG